MEKLKRNKAVRILLAIKNIICWMLIVCLAFLIVMMIYSRIKGEVPSVFGYSILRVSTGSMEPELMVGDVILDKDIDDVQSIKVDDVITYRGSGELSGMLITHKVIKAPYLAEDGTYYLQTKGIANEIADKEISADKVVSVMVCKIPQLDALYNFFLSPWGLVVFIVLIVLIFFDELVAFVRALTGNTKSAKDATDINEIIERLSAENKNKDDKEK
ncbi:signal peptidase I [Ruminococcus sp.]|uniref:signal peptidase I n=1 Tax=Ruminococcus sp. TaxID=41978 RepID=UPI003867FF63